MASSNTDNSKPVLLFASLPKRTDLFGVTVYVNRPPESSHYAKTAYQWLVLKCRMLIFAESQILSSPVFRSDSHLYIVASKTFLAAGKLKDLLERHGINESGSRAVEVTDSVLQSVLHYSLLARMAPCWNQLGPSYLVQGRDFLMETSAMSAVKLQILVQGDQVGLSVCPMKLRLPHLQLADLELGPEVASKFLSQQLAVITAPMVGCEWLCILPGLRRGCVVSVTHKLPPTCPFLSYRELRRHWKNMYGYRLPEELPNSTYSPAGPYITISFRKRYNKSDVGYTYPALCVRACGPMILQNVDQAAVVRDFASDLSGRLTQLCGLTFQLSLRLGHPLANLTSACSQSSQTIPANFTAVSLSSLPSGWKPSSSQQVPPSQQFSQSTQVHTTTWQPASTPSTVKPTPSPAFSQCTELNTPSWHNKPYPPAVHQKPSTQSSSMNPVTPQFKPPHSYLNNKFMPSQVIIDQIKSEKAIANQNLMLKTPKSTAKNIAINHDNQNFVSNESKNSYLMKTVGTPERVVSLNIPVWQQDSNCLSLATEAEDCAAQPVPSGFNQCSSIPSCAAIPAQSAASQRSFSKWDPKPLRQPVQDTAVTSSNPDRKLYVPVFGKKAKTAEQKKQVKKTPNPPAVTAPSQVSKPFKNPQVYASLPDMAMCPITQEPSSSKWSNSIPSIPAFTSLPKSINKPMTSTFSMSANPRSMPLNIDKTHEPLRPPISSNQKSSANKSLGTVGKSKSLQDSESSTPTKKPRLVKPEPSAENIERLAREGKLDQVSAPLLIKWLKDRGVPCKTREKKAILVTRATEHLNL